MKNNYPDIRIRETYDFDMPAHEGLVIEQDITQNIRKESDSDLYVLLNEKNEQKFISYTDIKPKEQK
jgi:heat shock protein HspQ